MDPYQALLSGQYYHVVSRANGNELLFRNAENYRFFMERYQKYIQPVATCFAFALLPNHFHFLIKIKDENVLQPLYKVATGKNTNGDWQPGFVIKQWSHLLNSYAKSFNSVYHRKGALFIDAIRRIAVNQESDLCNVAFYIHKNPVHHGFCKKISDWKWSSYNSIISQKPTLIERTTVLEWFGGTDRFIFYHNQPVELKTTTAFEI